MDVTLLETVGAILREAARTIVMPRFAQLAPGDIVMKGADDPVTIADREAEAMIGAALRALLPGAAVIGEEACASSPALLDQIGSGLVWVIDPIDGTANFAAGRPPFALMVALLKDGGTIGAWILDPLGDTLAMAERGSGAWLGGKRLVTARDDVPLSAMHGIVSRAFVPAGGETVVERLVGAVGTAAATARCAGFEYRLVASGARHFALYWRTLVWDHAPGVLLLTEAGGTATHLDGSPYRPAAPRAGLLLAHNEAIARRLRALCATTD